MSALPTLASAPFPQRGVVTVTMATGTRVPIVTMTVTMATWQLILHDLPILRKDGSADIVNNGRHRCLELIRVHKAFMAPKQMYGERLPMFVASVKCFGLDVDLSCCAVLLSSVFAGPQSHGAHP